MFEMSLTGLGGYKTEAIQLYYGVLNFFVDPQLLKTGTEKLCDRLSFGCRGSDWRLLPGI